MDNAAGAPKGRSGWELERKWCGMAGRAVLSMAVWGIGMSGMHCRYEQWPSNGQGQYDATRGGCGGVRIGEAKTPGPYSEGGATSSGLGGRASSQKVGTGRAGQQGGAYVGAGLLSGDAQGRGDGPSDERAAERRGRVEPNRLEATGRKKSRRSEREEGRTEKGLGGSVGKKEAAGGQEAQGGIRSAGGAAGEVRKGKPTLGFDHPEAEDPLDVLEAELANIGGNGPGAALGGERGGGDGVG